MHYYTPESATGYLIAQTRELLDDVPLAPIRAKAKVYIIDRAEQLRANTANALLKTLEEPPEGVMFILLGTSADVMLPTIVSRSPICNTRSGVARSITPLRSTRDTVTPNVLRKRNEPRRLPLISGRDTIMWRDTN